MIKVKIQSTYIKVTTEELAQIEKAFKFAVDRFEHIVRDVVVSLVDVNGPRGGVDKRCSVQLRLYPRGLAVVRSTGSDLLETVNETCNKMRQVISKRLSKKKSRSTIRITNDNNQSDLSAN